MPVRKHASPMSTTRAPTEQEEEPLLAPLPPPPGARRCPRGSPCRRRSCCLARDACEGEQRKGSWRSRGKKEREPRDFRPFIDGQAR